MTSIPPPPSPAPARRSLPQRLLRLPALVLVAIYFLIDDVVLAAFRPIVAWAAELRVVLRFAVFLRRLPPYPTLALFLVPFAVLEPVKILGLWMMATGSFRAGLLVLATAHVLSIVLVERLFQATRAKLMTIGWFAWGHATVMRLYDWSVGRLKTTEAWRWATATLRRLRAAAAAMLAELAANGLVRRLRAAIDEARREGAALLARLGRARDQSSDGDGDGA